MSSEPVQITLTRENWDWVLRALSENATRWRNRPGMRGTTVESCAYSQVQDDIETQLRALDAGEGD